MSSLVTGVINLTFGLLWNKFRDFSTEKLKEGDLTDEKCCELMAGELNNIKTKLDGLARKDLLTSVSFLEEGLEFLALSQTNEAKTDNNRSGPLPEISQEQNVINNATESVMTTTGGSSLSRAIGKLNIASRRRFEDARLSFEKSNTKATEAFNNEALSTADRILATKLRVVSRILKSFEDPEVAVVAGKRYIKELHQLRAIREVFSVQLDGGVRSVLQKAKRLDYVMSVTMINFVVFDFAKNFTKTSFVDDIYHWPTINLGRRTYNPLVAEGEIFKKLEESEVALPNEVSFKKARQITSQIHFPQANSKGEIFGVVHCNERDIFKFTAGEAQLFCSVQFEDLTYVYFEVLALAVDVDDNVYVLIVYLKSFADPDNYFKLFVFTANAEMKHQTTLDFMKESNGQGGCTIAANKSFMVIHHQEGDRIYVCEVSGNLKYSFPLQKWTMKLFLSISNGKDIIAAPWTGHVVFIYTEEGRLAKKFELPENHYVCGMALNHVANEVVVYSRRSDDNVYFSSYSETGELLRAIQPQSAYQYLSQFGLTSHPGGPVALVYGRNVQYI